MSNLFDSILIMPQQRWIPCAYWLAFLVSLFLGLALSWTYKYRTLYTREFVISLTLLPCMMTLVIFWSMEVWEPRLQWQGPLVWIRFRSATSGSRELIAIF